MKQLELDLGLQPIQRWLKDWNKKPPQRPAVHRAGEGEKVMRLSPDTQQEKAQGASASHSPGCHDAASY